MVLTMQKPDPDENNRLSVAANIGSDRLLQLLRNGDIEPVSFAFRKDAPPPRRLRWRYAKIWGVPPWLIFTGKRDILDRIWWKWQEIDSLWTLMLWGPIAWMALYAACAVALPVLAVRSIVRYISRAAHP